MIGFTTRVILQNCDGRDRCLIQTDDFEIVLGFLVWRRSDEICWGCLITCPFLSHDGDLDNSPHFTTTDVLFETCHAMYPTSRHYWAQQIQVLMDICLLYSYIYVADNGLVRFDFLCIEDIVRSTLS